MVAVGLEQRVAAGDVEIVCDHLGAHFLDGDFGDPAEFFLRLGGIAEEGFHFGGAVVSGIDADDDVTHGHGRGEVVIHCGDGGDFLFALAGESELDTGLAGGHADEFAHGNLLAGGDDEIVRSFLLEHHPLHTDIVLGMAPVAERVDVTEEQAGFETLGDVSDGTGDFAGDEGFAAARGLVVEEDAVARIHAIGFAVIHGDPVGIHLGDGVGRARVERGGFLLRGFLDQAVELGGGGLVEAGFLFEAEEANRLQQAQCADGIDVGGVFWGLEGDGDVGLRAEVVNFVWLDLADDAGEVRGVREIPVMQAEAGVLDVRVLVNVVDPLGVEERGAALDAVDFVAFFEQEFREVGSVLAGDAGDECFFHERCE